MTRKSLWALFGVALCFGLLIFVTPNTRADEWNQATQLTFNQPVQIPGNTVLPAGAYWFQVMNDRGLTPDFVQIFNADRTHLLATIDTVPATRVNPTSRTEVMFAEPSGNQPLALVKWFYPGRITGHEFIYSPSEEARLSESEHVIAMALPAPLVTQAG